MSLEGLVIVIVVFVVLAVLVHQMPPTSEPFRKIAMALLGLVVLVIVIKLLFTVLGPMRLGKLGAAPPARVAPVARL